MVRAPFVAIDVVPVAPNAAEFDERAVEEAPPLKARSVVVALLGNG